MADEKVPSKDIISVFKRLKSVGENKLCFDCRASNPTWASITYGVFLCIDCSAVHRGLGVHLTFIRSTQLDTSWTWLQIRHMQKGGNANANAFFRQHNLTTTDAGQKYKSRVASMYREKLDQLVNKSLREVGISSVHLDQQNPVIPQVKDEVDFFQNMEENFSVDTEEKVHGQVINNGTENVDVDVGHLSRSPPKKDIRVPTIGGRKPTGNKKKGLGAKKGGLGATKSKANFSAIESEAQQMDKMSENTDVIINVVDGNDANASSEVPLSTALMYQTSTMKREEEKLKHADPKKAQQLERLGMGFGGRASVSHSVAGSMQSVEQVKPDRSNDSNKDYYRSSQPDSFMGFEDIAPKSEADSFTEEPPSYESRFSNMSSWGNEGNSIPYRSEKEENDNSRSRVKHSQPTAECPPEDMHKKFGGAKGISSDQLFGTDQQNQASHNKLDQYQSSEAISSADLFGEKKKPTRSVDYQNIKESVSNVTGKLSNMASGVIGSLQSRYSGNN